MTERATISFKQRAAIGIGIVALTAGYELWRGYHQTHSIADGTASVAAGLIALALYLYFGFRSSAN